MDIQEQIDQLNRLVFSLHEVKPLTVEDIGKPEPSLYAEPIGPEKPPERRPEAPEAIEPEAKKRRKKKRHKLPQVHHIVERCKGGSDDLDNLVTLCLWCHTSKHMGEPVYNLMASRPEIATIP